MSSSPASTRPADALSWPLLLCAGAVIGLALGTRHVQGLFMLPMLGDRGWGREAFAFAAGLQTLAWGALQPFTGWLADRYGTARVLVIGCVVLTVQASRSMFRTRPAGVAENVPRQ